MCGGPINKRVFSCSVLILLLGSFGFAQPMTSTELLERLEAVESREQRLAIIDQLQATHLPEIARERFREAKQNRMHGDIRNLMQALELGAYVEESSRKGKPAVDKARRIKESPLYRDAEKEKESNWLSRSFEALGEALSRLFNRRQEQRDSTASPSAPSGQWLVYTMWGVLGVAAAVLLVLAARYFVFKRSLTRKAKALMEEDEPERTLDEWLALADQLTSEGKHREAVRCLYLACLLKFDEAGVARFRRGQTNWEHFTRIVTSPKHPEGLDFRAPTQAFDRVWYGMHVEGGADVERFKAWYRTVADSLRPKEAAQ